MTQVEKERINKLRAEGLGATRIAKKLGLSVNTVKSYLSRTPVIQPNVIGGSKCKQCGATILQHPQRKVKLFCSDTCRASWWNAHRGESKTTVTLSCATCGASFFSYRSESRKYCCHACYIKDRFGGDRHDG